MYSRPAPLLVSWKATRGNLYGFCSWPWTWALRDMGSKGTFDFSMWRGGEVVACLLYRLIVLIPKRMLHASCACLFEHHSQPAVELSLETKTLQLVLPNKDHEMDRMCTAVPLSFFPKRMVRSLMGLVSKTSGMHYKGVSWGASVHETENDQWSASCAARQPSFPVYNKS